MAARIVCLDRHGGFHWLPIIYRHVYDEKNNLLAPHDQLCVPGGVMIHPADLAVGQNIGIPKLSCAKWNLAGYLRTRNSKFGPLGRPESLHGAISSGEVGHLLEPAMIENNA